MKADGKAAERRGHVGESLAALWLRLKGYRILARRLKTHADEIDLVAAAPFGPVCFIEVKARKKAAIAALRRSRPASRLALAAPPSYIFSRVHRSPVAAPVLILSPSPRAAFRCITGMCGVPIFEPEII